MSANTIKEVRAWVTPILLVIIGFFSKNKLEEIDAKIDEALKGKDIAIVNRADILSIKENYKELRGEFDQHVQWAYKNEENITLDNIKKSSK